jgi:hypothetical protein
MPSASATGYRLSLCQAGDGLVPLPRCQQPRQILMKDTPLSQAEEKVVDPSRVLLQRPGAGGHARRAVILGSQQSS